MFPQEAYTLNESDFMIIQIMNNDLFYPGGIEKTQNPKMFHMTKFLPRPQSELQKMFEEFKTLLSKIRAKIILVDFIYRGLCCMNHKHDQIYSYQSKCNKLLKTIFREYYQDHLALCFSRKVAKRLKSPRHYPDILRDAVHLKDEHYVSMVKGLFRLLNL